MRRRRFLRTAATLTLGALGVDAAAAADTRFEPRTWYDATVTDVTDGDTIDVELDSDGTEYELRTLGFDSPETRRNGRHEEVREWEGIGDDKYLGDWGERAKEHAQAEFPDGTPVQIAVDGEEDEEDAYGRLLAYVRYDGSGDGSMDTLYNRNVIERGYARVYGSSLTRHDEFRDAEATARANGVGVWAESDPGNTSEVGDDPVDGVLAPHASSVVTDSGALPASRAPLFAPADATQELGGDGLAYAGDVPLVGVDAANRVAMLGGQFVDERYESDNAEGFVFLTNLIDSLSERTGTVLIDGGHHQFNADHSCSNEDTVAYQRYLEGQGIAHEQTNDLDGTDLPDARAIVVTSPEDAFASAEVDELSTFVADGGAVILFGSAASTDAGRANLDALAGALGTDLRLNDDRVYDGDGAAEYVTSNLNEGDFALFGRYS